VPIVRNIVAYAKHRASSGYHQSIVRRTAILCGLVLPGFAANFFVYFFTAQLLAPDQFGLFYVAATFGNILFSGSNVLNAFLTRHLVHVGQASGADAIVPATLRLERHVMAIGAILSTVLFLLFVAAMKQIGVQSPIIILLIILDAYTSYVTDLGRVLLQGQRKTLLLGVYTSTWMALRFALCIAGVLLFRTVWGALCGIVLSTTLVFAVFHLWILRATRNRPAPASVHLPLFALVPAAAGYGLMVLVSNLDVLFGYFVLNQNDLGSYSASSVFPKAALVIVTPLLQMLIPAMIGVDPLLRRPFHLVAARIGGVIFALTAVGSALVWLLSDQLCGSRWGLKLCEPPILGILLISVVPLALLRTLVVIEFARGRELLLLWLAVPAAGYSLFIWMSSPTMNGLAVGFSAFSFVAFFFFAAVCLIAQISRHRSLARKRSL
jgi:O-antigen/teichoic acid export membrane protein